MQLIKAPSYENQKFDPSIFLAGSIDMGSAVNWQKEIEEVCEPYDVTVFNPRRDDWDSSWEQSINNPQFKEQVLWELEALNSASLVVYYFDPKGLAPITLLELGSFAFSGGSVVCCPEGYWRKGNVDVWCEWQDVPMVDSLDELKLFVQSWILDRFLERL